MNPTKGTVRPRSACIERKPHLAVCGDRQRRFPASVTTLDRLLSIDLLLEVLQPLAAS